MIQRIQTVFLFLASGCFFGQFGTNMATASAKASGFLSDQLYSVMDHTVLVGMAAVGGLLGLVSIFLFKNRNLQKRLSLVTLIMAILFPIVSYWLFMIDTADVPTNVTIEDSAGSYLPFSAIILSILAIYFIGKDDKLVKSMDRLR